MVSYPQGTSLSRSKKTLSNYLSVLSGNRLLRGSLFQSKVWRNNQRKQRHPNDLFRASGRSASPIPSAYGKQFTRKGFFLGLRFLVSMYVFVYWSALEADRTSGNGNGNRDLGDVSCLRSSPCARGRLVQHFSHSIKNQYWSDIHPGYCWKKKKNVLHKIALQHFKLGPSIYSTTNMQRKMNVWLNPNKR